MEKQEAIAAAAKAAWIEAEKALNKQQPISGDVNFHLKVLAILPKAKKSKTNLLFLTIIYMYISCMSQQRCAFSFLKPNLILFVRFHPSLSSYLIFSFFVLYVYLSLFFILFFSSSLQNETNRTHIALWAVFSFGVFFCFLSML